MISAVSRQTISRLPVYLGYLRSLEGSMLTISATAIAEALSLNDVQVRKDLAAVSSSGKPKIGYVTADLISVSYTHLRGEHCSHLGAQAFA